MYRLTDNYNVLLSTAVYIPIQHFGDVSDPIHLTNLACSGSEYRVTDCQYNTDTIGHSHIEDWNVYCVVGQYTHIFAYPYRIYTIDLIASMVILRK